MDAFNIAPPAAVNVPVDGGEVSVRGLSNRVVFKILAVHPELAAVVSGGGVDFVRAMSMAPDACLALMAAGAGVAGDADKESALDALPMESQLDVLSAIVRRTCPGGVGPFVSRLLAMWTTEPAMKPMAEEDDGVMSKPPSDG